MEICEVHNYTVNLKLSLEIPRSKFHDRIAFSILFFFFLLFIEGFHFTEFTIRYGSGRKENQPGRHRERQFTCGN